MNRLLQCSSPYLHQHANNPVDWQPWDNLAWQQAKSKDQLVVVSIGYSTCHWCHVMAHEVFEDQAVAEFQNRNFVSIKVDREERPDLDKVYMDSCRVLSGQGGWPLNVICLPDGRPVQACTYLPKDIWVRYLGQIHLLWIEHPEKLLQQAVAVTEAVRGLDQNEEELTPQTQPSEGFRRRPDDLFREIWSRISPHCDFEQGGFAGAPKFPVPVMWESLLELGFRNQIQKHLQITLEKMALGGIYDQVGGGFFRYSTDGQWHIPHFEKMLYDNAQLLSLYARSLQRFPFALSRQVLRQTVAWMQSALQSPEGLWYSALNADTDGVEGATYVWTQDQAFQAAPENPLLEEYLRALDITSHGNWEHGNSHPRMAPHFAKDLSIAESAQVLASLEPVRMQMLLARNARSQPSRDEKILLEWNALAAKGLLDAGRALDDLKMQSLGLDTLEALFKHLRDQDGVFYRSLCNGKLGTRAFLADLAVLADACYTAHECTLAPRWLDEASTLVESILREFSRSDTPLLAMNDLQSEQLFTVPVEIRDDVIPSSNSVFARVLLKLGNLLEKPEWKSKAEAMIHTMRETALNAPTTHPNWIRALFDLLYPAPIIKIQGPEAQRWSRELWMIFPRCTLSGSYQRQGKTTATVCGVSSCLPEVDSLKDLLGQVGKEIT